MIRLQKLLLLSTCFLSIAPASAMAAADCGDIGGMDQYEQLKLDEDQIVQYINRGCPPPSNRYLSTPGELSDVPGSGSTPTHGQNAPDMPPGVVNAPASVSNSQWGFSLSLPPWQGFPCQLPGGNSICGGGSGGGSSSSGGGSGMGGGGGAGCPPRDDTSATFGERIPLTGVTSQPLACGGSVTLGATQYSIVPGANRLAILDMAEYSMKLYELKNVTVPTMTGGTTTVTRFEHTENVPLPQSLCMPTGLNNAMEKSVDLLPPVAQIFAYTTSTPRLVVRLLQDPQNPPFNPFEPIDTAKPEKFLIVPINNGKPKDLTAECAKETDHYTDKPPATADIDIFPVASPTCEASTIYPNAAACTNKMLVTVTDDPLLVHEPERTATFYPLSDRPESMARSSAESLLMMQNPSSIRIGASGLKFTLPEGGVLPLKNGKYLRMNGPVDIMGNAKSISLRGGGQIEDGVGAMVSSFPPNSTVSPDADLPYIIRPFNKVVIPEGLIIPSKVGGYIRLPVSTQ